MCIRDRVKMAFGRRKNLPSSNHFVYVFLISVLSTSILFLNFLDFSQYIFASLLQNSFCEALFFAYCPAIFEGTPLLFLGKRKAGIAPSLRIKIHFSTTFWSNLIRILAACALVVVPAGSKVPSSWPLISALPLAQLMAGTAHSCTESPSLN